MVFREILLSGVDFEDETLRVSEDLDVPGMPASLRAVGLINPVVLHEGASSSRYRIVCGFRRLHGMRSLGIAKATARILPLPGDGILELFLTAVWDNLAHRKFSPLEASRILSTLKQTCGIDNRTLVERYLPLLGLSSHENVLRSYLNLQQLRPDLRCMLQTGRLTLASAERLSRETPHVQERLAPLYGRVQLSASLQREVLDLAQDLAALMGTDMAGIFCCPEISAIAEDTTLSGFQKGERLHALLYRRRNPRITRVRDKFQADRAAMELPGSVRLTADPHFESPRLRVEFDVTSARDFRETVTAIERCTRSSRVEQLFEVI
jgi:hypothetical protein